MHSGSYAWFSHDDYGNQDTSLNRTVDLTGVTHANLTFWHWYHTESGYDIGRVEVNDGSSGWTAITPEGGYPGSGYWSEDYSGQSNGWVQATFDLTDYAGQSINLRFRYAGDYSTNYIGWYVDDINIGEIGFSDDVESGAGDWTASSAKGSMWSRSSPPMTRDNTLTNNTLWDICIEDSDSRFTNNTLNGTTVSFTYGGDVSLKGTSSPAADPSGQQTIGKFINASNQSTGAWLFLNFSYSDADVSGLDESNLAVWKHNGTMWLKDDWNGSRHLDTAGNVVGVNIMSFSVFAPAASTMVRSHVPPDPTNLVNTTDKYWVNYTWSPGAGNVTDSYNVNLNGAWTNGTTDMFMNASVGHSGWANITVFAYNASDTGTESAGSVSDSVQAPTVTPGNYVPEDPTNLANTVGSYGVNYTWSPGAGNVTDSYNVNLNGAWTNGTTDMFMNASVSHSGWVNITVFAHNASGTGTLSTGSVSAKTQTATEDTIPPTIESVTPDAHTTIPDTTIHVIVNATDDVGITSVTANGAALAETGSTWEGDITAPSTSGDYTIAIRAEDAAGNFAETTVNYSVVNPSGSMGIGVDPRLTTVSAGDTALINIKLVSTENFDDIAHIYMTAEGTYPGYQADLTWFNWTSIEVGVPAGAVVNVLLEVNIPGGESGYNMFYAKLESTKWTPTAMDTGILYITN